MDLITNPEAAMEMLNFIPGSSYIVEVTHINDPHSFYVRPIAVSEKLLEILEATGSSISEADVKIGRNVIYKSKTLIRHVRGLIEVVGLDESKTEMACTIFAVDYGCRDTNVPLEHIHLPVENNNCLPLAAHCILHLCESIEDTFDDEAINAMKFFVGKHAGRITVVCRIADKLVVNLKTVECPDDVSTMLALLHFTTLLNGTNQVSRFYQSMTQLKVIKYKYKDVSFGDKMIVRVQSGDSISSFYVAEVSEHKYYNSSSNKYDFNDYCKRQPLQDVVVASADARCCGVRIQYGMYERGIVKKVIKPNKTALVKLIDLGTEKIVKFEDIKRADSEVYTQRPAVAIYCSSSEEQTWHNGLPKFLYPGFQFEIEIIKVGNGIDIPHKVNMAKTKYFF